MSNFGAIYQTAKRECVRMSSRPLYLFCMVIAPLFCYIFFTTLMASGLPVNLPVAAVDMDETATSRSIIRNLDSFEQTQIAVRYADVSDARRAMQRGEIYGFYYIPPGLSKELTNGMQPTVSFYTNNSYLIAGSMLFRDMKTTSELVSGSAIRTKLLAKGMTDGQAMAFIQPIVIDTHAINNPWLNYSVYLSNTLLPGVLGLLIMMVTVFSIGVEIKDATANEWLQSGKGSIILSLTGKLLPQTVVFMLMGMFYNAYLYGYLHYPNHSGAWPMLFATFMYIAACQGLGIFMVGLLPNLRQALSFASLWGVVSFSISGLSFPVLAMHPSLQYFSHLFPLRHYFLIYVNQALNGYEMYYCRINYLALFLFILLPLFFLPRLKKALGSFKYIP